MKFNVLNVEPHLDHLPPEKDVPEWLRSILLKVRDWLDTFDRPDPTYTPRRYMVDLSDVVREAERMWEVVRRYTNKRPAYLVVGETQFYEFMSLSEKQQMGQFINYETALGFNLVVVPWIDGAFLLPELDYRL